MSSDVTSINYQDNINSSKPISDNIYEFEGFRLDVPHLMLYKNEQPVSLAPKVIETLVALVERRGEVVSKDEMMERLWKDSFVEESNLTQNIYLLRKTLGKATDGHDLIETFRRRGYRFNGKLQKIVDKPEIIAEKPDQPPDITEPSDSLRNKENVFDSLAVLPFTNENGDVNAEYLSDDITESVINRLSQISRLRVVARNTVFQYKNRDASPIQIGRELGVSAILTGRILQHEERLIVRVELAETNGGWQIWGEQYDRRVSDILELQETIAREISENLHLKLTGEEQKLVTKRYTESSEAYNLFVKGRHHLNKRLTRNIAQAADYFQQAIDADPTFALAYIGLADCYPLLSLYGALTPHEAYPKARAAAEKALKIDRSLTKAYNSLGVVKLFYEWDWTGAETAFRQALELNPGYPDAHQRYGMFLTAMMRCAEAETEFARARELDPLSLITQTLGGYPYYYSRQFDEAGRRFSEVIKTDENYSMAHFRLGLTYAQQGKFAEAITELKTSLGLSNDRDTIAALGYVQGLAGNSAEAIAALNELDEREKNGFVTSYNRALINIGLGETDAAFDWLEKAFEERSYWLIYLKVDPALDSLRPTKRFADLQAKVFHENESADTSAKLPSIVLPTAINEKPDQLPTKNHRSNRLPNNKMIRYSVAGVIGLLVILAGSIFAPRFFSLATSNDGSFARSNVGDLKITSLTPDLNTNGSAISPDGKHLAYVLVEKDRSGMWLKDMASGEVKNILPPIIEGYDAPLFSPDGKWLYFGTSRKDVPNKVIFRIPVSGGESQEIAQNVMSPPAISPDGNQIAFVREGGLIIVRTDGSGERMLSRRPTNSSWYESWGSNMSWSPDGRSIAICGRRIENNKKRSELIEVLLADGSERNIPTPDWNVADDVAWLSDKSALLVVARETEVSPFQIWRVAYPQGATERITNNTSDYTNLSLTTDSQYLVTDQKLGNFNIWTAPFDASSQIKQITFGNAAEDGFFGTAFTPDGKIIYTSPRDGNLDLWVMNADGSAQKQLTKNAGDWNGRPRCTPDGRFIVFASSRSGRRQIWRMDADGGNPQQLTDVFHADSPVLSPDGAMIYFANTDNEKMQICKVSIGGGEIICDSRFPQGNSNSVSPDGTLLAYSFYDEGTLQPWKTAVVNLETGKQVRIFDFISFKGSINWSDDSKSLYFNIGSSPSNIWEYPLDEKTLPRRLTNFERGQIAKFSISPDFKSIVFSRGNSSYEAVLISNFHNINNP